MARAAQTNNRPNPLFRRVGLMTVRLNGWRLLSEKRIENAFTLTLILLAGK